MSNTKVAVAIVGALLATLIIFMFLICVYLYSCCTFETKSDRSNFRLKDITVNPNGFRKPLCPPNADLEAGNVAPITTLDPKYSEDGVLLVSMSKTKRESFADLRKVISSFDTTTNGLIASRSPSCKRPSNTLLSIEFTKDQTSSKSVAAIPSTLSRQYIIDQYETFARTLALQSMIENSLNPENTVFRKVRDPYLNALINVGELVVVAKPYHGKGEFDFHHLLPGDLLKIIKLYIRDDALNEPKSLLLKASFGENEINHTVSTKSEPKLENPMLHPPPFIDQNDPNYSKIYCSGVKLDTYLEYDEFNKSMRFKIANTPQVDPEIIRDFPLSVVTLETTILQQCE